MLWDFSADAAESAPPPLFYYMDYSLQSCEMAFFRFKKRKKMWLSELFSSWPWDLQTKHPDIYLLMNFSPGCLRPNKYGKTEKASHWKSTPWWFETCAIVSENSFAISHGLLENAQQILAGAGGLHLTEPFPHTFLAADIKFKGRSLGDLFCQRGGCLLGDMVGNWCVCPMHSIMKCSGKGQCSLALLIYLHSVSWRFKWGNNALGAQSTMPPKVFWCQKRLRS